MNSLISKTNLTENAVISYLHPFKGSQQNTVMEIPLSKKTCRANKENPKYFLRRL